MNSIQIGWIDYSSEHRKTVLAVLQSMTTPGAVDEIGIGQIRDGFANRLFPGTSTIQTRAKYFFIVPYILMDLEKQKIVDSKAMRQKLNDIELELINPLKKSAEKRDEVGIIGETAGKKLKRKPSDIYWNGLRIFGFFKYPHLSLDEYVRGVCVLNQESQSYKSFGSLGESGYSDDPDASQDLLSGRFWRCLLPSENWQKDISIHLTRDEAVYLRERIRKSPHSKDSLLAFLLKTSSDVNIASAKFETLGHEMDLPSKLKSEYELAKRFSDFIYGATLRYNIILYDGQNPKANKLWQEWCDSAFVARAFSGYNTSEAMDYLQIHNMRLKLFLVQWKEAFLSGNTDEMDTLIMQREIELKGRERAKLSNPDLVVQKEGKGLLGDKLNYRFGNAKVLISDIFTGLESGHA